MKKPENFHVRNYRPGDDRVINRFINDTFNLDVPLETWRWKYLRNPTASRLNITLGWLGNRLVAHFGCRHRYYKVGDRVVLTAHPAEVAVHKKFRKTRILMKTKRGTVDRAKALGCAFGFGFPTEAHFKVGTKLLSYRHVTDMPVLEGRVPSRNGNRPQPGLVRSMLSFVSTPRLKGKRSGADAGLETGIRIRPMQRFDSRFDALWESLAKQYPVIGDRKSRYLNWRYTDHPGRRFMMLEITRGESLQGFAVLVAGEAPPGGEKVATIMEFFTTPEETIRAMLFEAAMEALCEAGVQRCRCACLPHMALHSFLLKRGMAPSGDVLKFVIEIYDETLDPDLLMNGENWFLGFGDFDLFD